MKHLSLILFVVLVTVSCSNLNSSDAINTLTATAVHPTLTSLPTSIPLPSSLPTAEFPVYDGGTLSPSTAVISKDNLAQLRELALWGKGAIKSIKWSDDGKQISIVTSVGQYVYDSDSFQRSPEANVQLTDAKPKITLSVDGYNYQSPTSGFDVVVNSDSSKIGSFHVQSDTWGYPNLIYLSESNVIVIDRHPLVELRDGTSYEVFHKLGEPTYIWDVSADGSNPEKTDSYSSLDVTKDRTVIAAGRFDGKIILSSGDGYANNLTLETGGAVRFLSFSPDGSKLVSESNGSISVWDVSSGKAIGTLPDTFTSGDFFYKDSYYGADGQVGVTVKENTIAYTNKNNVILLDLLDGKKSGFIDGKEGSLFDKQKDGKFGHPDYQPINAVFFSADGQSLITALDDRAYIWNISNDQFVRVAALATKGDIGRSISVYSASDHLWLFGNQQNNFIKITNVDDGSNLPSIKAWNVSHLQYGYDGTHSLTISPDGKFVFSWSGLEGVANLWDIQTQQRVMDIKIPASEYSKYQPGFYPVAISPDNKKLVFTYSLDPGTHIAAVYSITDGKELYKISEYYAVFSPDGSIIAASWGNGIIFYDAETGERLWEALGNFPNTNPLQLLYFSEDGKSLIAVSNNGTIGIWGIP